MSELLVNRKQPNKKCIRSRLFCDVKPSFSFLDSISMCELDIFVGNYAIIDWEVYSLWLSGRSVAEAVPVFVRDNRTTITDFHVSQDMIVSDFEDNWRLFTTLENALNTHETTTPLQLLDLGMLLCPAASVLLF